MLLVFNLQNTIWQSRVERQEHFYIQLPNVFGNVIFSYQTDCSPNIGPKQKHKRQNIFFNFFFLSSKPQFFSHAKTEAHTTHIRDALEAPVA